MNTGTGNQVTDDDLLKILLALKDNVMRSCNVSEICEVISNKDGRYGCKIMPTGEEIACYATTIQNIAVGDYVLVTFTNSDFRPSLKRIKNLQPTQKQEDKVLHTKDNGVITGLIYM